jgi:DNA-binding GntR family transcriptional regulator
MAAHPLTEPGDLRQRPYPSERPDPREHPDQPAPGTLVARLAKAFGGHEPGWRLPRRSDLARRYHVTMAEIDAAITALADRCVVRETADGHACLASPADFLLTLDQLPCLGSRIDPMGAPLECARRTTVHRTVPEEITRALGMPRGAAVHTVQTSWSTAGKPSAVATTYVPGRLTAQLMPALTEQDDPAAGLNPVLAPRSGCPLGSPAARLIDIQPPPRWAARMLRLGPGDPAITLTVRLDDPAIGVPVALTTAILHPARFRVVAEAPLPAARPFGAAGGRLPDQTRQTSRRPPSRTSFSDAAAVGMSGF